VIALSAVQLCLKKVGNPLNFGADHRGHDNEICNDGAPSALWTVRRHLLKAKTKCE